ncbi:MAG TPA: hypothetical protein VMD53_09035 [Rhizomicrobium sp.]|nr:hypothetical protein [Rhizomicrobium sp.]
MTKKAGHNQRVRSRDWVSPSAMGSAHLPGVRAAAIVAEIAAQKIICARMVTALGGKVDGRAVWTSAAESVIPLTTISRHTVRFVIATPSFEKA